MLGPGLVPFWNQVPRAKSDMVLEPELGTSYIIAVGAGVSAPRTSCVAELRPEVPPRLAYKPQSLSQSVQIQRQGVLVPSHTICPYRTLEYS